MVREGSTRVFVYDDISNFVSVDVMVREGLLGFVCMMTFLTFVSVDVMVREGSSRVCVYDVFF
jgi:hypothetical protein